MVDMSQPGDFVEIYQAENMEYSWRLKSRNGQIIGTPGETFETYQSAERSARRVFPGVTDIRDTTKPHG